MKYLAIPTRLHYDVRSFWGSTTYPLTSNSLHFLRSHGYDDLIVMIFQIYCHKFDLIRIKWPFT